jgi:hypothetical protein
LTSVVHGLVEAVGEVVGAAFPESDGDPVDGRYREGKAGEHHGGEAT